MLVCIIFFIESPIIFVCGSTNLIAFLGFLDSIFEVVLSDGANAAANSGSPDPVNGN